MEETEGIGIVVFAFGAPATILSNRLIAQISLQKAYEFKAPIYTQFDIGILIESKIKIKYTDEKLGNPPSTFRIARGAVQWAKQRKFRKLLVVAAKPHLHRCLRDIGYAIHESGVQIDILACKEVEYYSEDIWFSPASKQRHTRSQRVWNWREKIIGVIPMFLYKFLAH